MLHTHHASIAAAAPLDERARTTILTPDALAFLGELHVRFDAARLVLLHARRGRRAALAAGGTLDFGDPASDARAGDWQVAPPRPDYVDRRVERIVLAEELPEFLTTTGLDLLEDAA